MAAALVPHFYVGWRVLFAIGALIGLAGVLFGLRLPESPRWLIPHGHLDKGEIMVGSMEQRFGFAVIGVTGLLAGLITLGGPKTSGRSLEKVTR